MASLQGKPGSQKSKTRRFILSDSVCKNGLNCLEEHLASKRVVGDRQNFQVKSQLIGKLRLRDFGALLDRLARATR